MASSATYSTWNDYIRGTVQGLENSGKKVYQATDKYGQLHYSTKSQDYVNSIADQYNTYTSPTYKTADNTVFTMYDTGNVDANKNAIYDTMESSLYKQKQEQDQAKKDTQSAYADVDTKAKDLLDTNNAITDSNYDASAKQYYTNYMLNQKKLAESLSGMGATGGVSEMANIGLMNNYASNYATNEGQRNSAKLSNQQQYADQVYQNSQALASQLASLASQRQSENTAYWQNERSNLQSQQNAKLQAKLDVSTYKKKLAADSKQADKDRKALNKANNATLKSLKAAIKKGTKTDNSGNTTKPTYYIYYDSKGYLHKTKSKSVAQQNGGIKYGSRTSIEELNARKTTKQAYRDSNYYSKVYK